mmetsp:Transcript_14408/g.51838  ORF Transcript_14408/g.51838 Transcript_14408/m.51838 type:complete len:203 (-) Transcript_14408:807-1415(-)
MFKLRERVHHVGQRLDVQVLVRQRQHALADDGEALGTRVRLEHVERPEDVRELGDDVGVAASLPRFAHLIHELVPRVVAVAREPPDRVRHPLRRERVKLIARHARERVHESRGQRHDVRRVPRGPQRVGDALRRKRVGVRRDGSTHRVVQRDHHLPGQPPREPREVHGRDRPDDVRELHRLEPAREPNDAVAEPRDGVRPQL